MLSNRQFTTIYIFENCIHWEQNLHSNSYIKTWLLFTIIRIRTTKLISDWRQIDFNREHVPSYSRTGLHDNLCVNYRNSPRLWLVNFILLMQLLKGCGFVNHFVVGVNRWHLTRRLSTWYLDNDLILQLDCKCVRRMYNHLYKEK